MKAGIFFITFLAFVAAETAEIKDEFQNFRDPILSIVGGSQATQGQFPYQLRLLRSTSFICGAVLISTNRALTAAHCMGSGTYSVQCAQHNTAVSGQEQTINVSSWASHPSYSGSASGYPNDIAILRLSGNFNLNNNCATIEMASTGDYMGESCYISGWGKTSGDGSFPGTLMFAQMPVITNSECSSRWSEILGATILNSHICVYESGKSACSGDCGGPMQCGGRLAGITSWGISSCSGSYPSVYTRVTSFRSWVLSNMN